jgi:hypothetical protein
MKKLRCDDGTHLDERSAVVAGQALEEALSSVPVARNLSEMVTSYGRP